MQTSRAILPWITIISVSASKCDCGGEDVPADAGFPDGSIWPDATLPPDPRTVAPKLEPAVPTQLADALEFLYSGDSPVQTGVAPGTIVRARVALVRGEVTDDMGAPLSGVTVSFANHPELGQTLSRLDGRFDLAFNAGGPMTLRLARDGFVSADRLVDVTWRETLELDKIVLKRLDQVATQVTLSAGSALQLHRASKVEDESGARQASLLFQAGTTAELIDASGVPTPASNLTVRATELTVGESGPRAMPALLPPSSAYTYAVELSADEAIAADAKTVRFSRPVAFYVENFLGMPVGAHVPTAWWNRAGAWVPSDDGRVIRIQGAQGGLAELDTDGDSLPDSEATLSMLGVTSDERRSLASTYSPGVELWRAQAEHFTTYDLNYGIVPPNDALPPKTKLPVKSEDSWGDWLDGFGSIELETQIFQEAIPIVGAPYALTYSSERVVGRSAARMLQIPLTGPDTPATLESVELEVQLAGRRFNQSFPAASGLSTDFVWDGLDAYGRALQGAQPVTVRIDYLYPGFYALPPYVARSFDLPSSAASDVASLTSVRLSQTFRGNLSSLGGFDARGLGLGGWSLDVHHVYDFGSRTLLMGDGRRTNTRGQSAAVVTRLAGVCGEDEESGDGGPASEAGVGWPNGLAYAPDGSLYIASVGRVRRVSPDGVIQAVAGTGVRGYSGDDGPALDAQLDVAAGIAVGPDGSIFVADYFNHSVRKIADGSITTIAGGHGAGFSGDGGAASAATLHSPRSLAMRSDGTLYLADSGNDRIRRITPDGRIDTVVRCPTCEGTALTLPLSAPAGLGIGSEGSLYVGAGTPSCVFRVTPEGRTSTVAGVCGRSGFSGDGDLATSARLAEIMDLDLGPDDTVYVAERCNHRIRSIGPDGLIRTVAGCSATGAACQSSCDPDLGTPAGAYHVYSPRALAIGPEGQVAFAEGRNRISLLSTVLPGVGLTDHLIPSDDGELLYRFDLRGRHLETLLSLTGKALLTFGYDPEGRLESVTDASGNRTRVERDATGTLEAIVGPFDERTALALDADGYLARVENPAGEATRLTYARDGLLTGVTGPDDRTFEISYDDVGRVALAKNPRGARTEIQPGLTADGARKVSLRSPMGRLTEQVMIRPESGELLRVTTRPDGTKTEVLARTDGSLARISSDGARSEQVMSADPRFGMLAPLSSLGSVLTPSGRVVATVFSREVVSADPMNPLGAVARMVETSSLAGRSRSRTTYDGASRTFTVESPAGRRATFTIDEAGRELERRVGNFLPIATVYDAKGRITSITQGDRSTSLTYDTKGLLESLRDAEGGAAGFQRDAAGRVIQLVGPDGTVRSFGYDAAGRLVSVAPPDRPAHTFERSPTGHVVSYVPAGVALAAIQTQRDLDEAITQVTGPITDRLITHDAAGRIATEQSGAESITATYRPEDGKVATLSTADGETLAVSYDGPLVTGFAWSGPIAGSVAFAYDDRFYLESVTVGGGASIGRSYDSDGFAVQVGTLAVEYAPANGYVSAMSQGLVRDERTWNEYGQPADQLVTVSGSPVLELHLLRDKLGRINERRELVEGESKTTKYGYDSGGRLIRVEVDGVEVARYTFDSNGNRLTYFDGTESAATYDDEDRILTQGGVSYSHDAEGRRTGKVSGGSTTYGFDGFQRLRQLGLPDGSTIDYVLDGLHRRVGKRVGGELVQGFLYQDELRVVAELDGAGNVVSTFAYAGASLVPDFMVRGGRTYRLVSDHLGSPRLVIDIANGAVAQRMDFDAFGRVLADTNPGFQPFGFAGGLFDRDTGLVHFGAREYDPETARWLSRDPLRMLGGDLNLYAYVRGDPVNSTDPSGLGPTTPSIESLAVKWNKNHPGEDTRYWDPVTVSEELGVPTLTRDQMAQIDHINTSMHTMQYLIPINENDSILAQVGKRGARLLLAVPATQIPYSYEMGKGFDQLTGLDVFGRIAADTGSFNTPETSRASFIGLWRGVEGLFMSVATSD